MRNVKIEIRLSSSYDYGHLVHQLAARTIPHEASLAGTVKFTVVVIATCNAMEQEVDCVLSHNNLQAIKSPFTVVEKPKHASPVSFLKRAA